MPVYGGGYSPDLWKNLYSSATKIYIDGVEKTKPDSSEITWTCTDRIEIKTPKGVKL